jgi:hypothetical protein
MRLNPDYALIIVPIFTALPAVTAIPIAIPLPQHHQSSMFHEALEALEATARFVTNKAEHEFSSGKTLDSTDNTPPKKAFDANI